MSARARAVLDEFARDEWSDAFLAGFYALLEDAPGEVPVLVSEGVERGLERAHFLGEAVGYLPPEALPGVIDRALAAYARPEARPAADDVLSHAALQFPRLFHPRLTEIFERCANAEGYVDAWPWRESGELHHAYLLGVVRGGGKRARGALLCLLETRTPAAFEAALRHGHPRRPWWRPGGPSAETPPGPLIREVGYEPAEGGGWRALYPSAAYHVRFPDGHRDRPDTPPHLRTRHPTWRLEAEDATPARFGGAGRAACPVCGEEAHHLLTLDPVPAGVGVTSVPALTLEVCFRCVWFNPELWWKHDEAGRPAPHRRATGEPGEWEGARLREVEVRLVRTPARWRWQDWGSSNSRENLTRLGGHPCWIQDADYPLCPECGKTMAFLLQVDADLPAEDGGYAFEEGIVYTFWCDACRVSVSLHQQT